MNGKRPWKYLPPAGPIVGLLLIGLVLLSALLYYRSVKIQRFLEPALALSQPRNEFIKNTKELFQKEFDSAFQQGITVKANSIFIDSSLLFSQNGQPLPSTEFILRKIARIFLTLLEDEHTRSEIGLVLIIGRSPPGGGDIPRTIRLQRIVGFVQTLLYRLEPSLGRVYAPYFASAVRPAGPQGANSGVVEFRIVPSDFLHIEVLEKLEKYAE